MVGRSSTGGHRLVANGSEQVLLVAKVTHPALQLDAFIPHCATLAMHW